MKTPKMRTNPFSEEESRKIIQEFHRKNPTIDKKDKEETLEKSEFSKTCIYNILTKFEEINEDTHVK